MYIVLHCAVQPLGLYTCDVTNNRVLQFNGVEAFQVCQDGLPEGFMATFKKGVDAYFDADWAAARDVLKKALKLKKGDGPIETLMAVMKATDYMAPGNWKGYRQLTEK